MQETTKCKVHTPLLKATLHNRQVNGGLIFIMAKKMDIVGLRFGKLTVLDYAYSKNCRTYWKCKCDCGNEKIALGKNLMNKNILSCGCMKGKHTKHNLSETPLYNVWEKIKIRCYNKNSTVYKNYGGRGIIVCDDWRNNFQAFYDWAIANGYKEEKLPSGRNKYQIDRIDVNGNYEPLNCRWVTPKEQQRNRRNNKIIDYKGEKKTFAEICEENNLDYNFVANRLRRGKSILEALADKKDCRKYYNYNGILLTAKEISLINGISVSTINARFALGWSVEKVINTKLRREK